ncbi:hypothetical protein Mth01_38010 [Sphaerimonospora thailandensis]|uniref:Uncharacterized protein n=1 Tax=Sphaerimonospora thailandensis TaxID=795644 RepID=A0A8J3RFP8_9ACTN|nr:hypothetical protein Mth01_38010 [Sphaerimonospora thailandensis]
MDPAHQEKVFEDGMTAPPSMHFMWTLNSTSTPCPRTFGGLGSCYPAFNQSETAA